MLDLGSVKAKLKWARHHFEAVDGEIRAWLETKPHEFVYERNAKLTKHWFRLRVKGETPDFERWSLMIGDAVTNLRDTLDHLVFAIAEMPTSPNPSKREKAAFIIRDRNVDFIKDARTRLASVPDPVRNSILGFQPFNRPHPELPPLLRILGELANGNKHKLLSVMLTVPESYEIEFVSSSGVRQAATFDVHKGDIKDGTVVLIFELPQPDPLLQLNPKSKIGLHLALRHEPIPGDTKFGADRTSYRGLMNALFAEVQIVIDTLSGLV